MSLVDTKGNPVPEGAIEGFISTPDRIKLRYAHWPTTSSQRRGTVTLLQGRAEFIEKYFEVIVGLRGRGFDVVAFDWRGQGGSERLTGNPNRGHVSNFRKFRTDLRTVLKEISLATYPGPHFALAHSTGGLILLSDSQRLKTMLDRAVITAPLLGLPHGTWAPNASSWSRRIVRIATLGLLGKPTLKAEAPKTSWFVEKIAFPISRLASTIGLGRLFVPGGNGKAISPFEGNRQTTDKSQFRRFTNVLENYPELGIGAPTLGWLNAAARTMKALRLRGAGPNMKLPCLILGAGNDQVVSTPAIEEFVSRTKAAAYLEIPGASHELMMEADAFRDQFWAAFDAFVPGLEADLEFKQASG
ncbi:MAG: alpha/beta hydrolase [Roseibium sp.]